MLLRLRFAYLIRSASYWWASLLVLLSIVSRVHAQGPTWQGAMTIPAAATQAGTYGTQISYTAADRNGNVYITGTFHGSIVLGANTLTSTFSQIFVAKWSSATGQFVWGITQNDALFPTGLVVQGATVYVSASSSYSIGYLIKLTDAGTSASVGWTKTFANAVTGGLAVSGTSIYVVGSFLDPTLTLGTTTLTNTGYSSLFVAKLTDTGTTASYNWALRAGGSTSASSVLAEQLVVQGSAVYLTGYFTAAAFFGATQVTSTGQADVFISKLTDSGSAAQFTWTKTLTGNRNDLAPGLVVVGTSIYVSGSFFSSTLTCGTTTLVNTSTTTNTDCFITKLTDAGSTSSFIWAQRAGGPVGDVLNGMVVQGSTVYVTGYFGSSVSLQSISFGSITLLNAGPRSGFVAALTDTGTASNFAWAQVVGGTGDDYMTSLSTNGPTIYLGGYIGSSSVQLGPYSVANYSTLETGLLASFTSAVSMATAITQQLAGNSLYPNPATGSITCQVPAVAGVAEATLTVYDALGKTVRTATIPLPAAGSHYDLSLSGLVRGVYQVQMQAGEQTAWHRLLVQ